MISLTSDPIDVASALTYLQSDQAGALDLFLGVVRDNTQERPVDRLEYEAYDRMAISEMQKIADEAHRRWPILRYTIIHRKGVLAIGETAIFIGVATAHRADAFDACRFMIDTIKQTVPIWKKEVFTDGEVWVNAHP
ncbi:MULTISPECIES: molybdenum cofactor biosynthesis protein MoaE [Spirosoma]|uniref:Molybdopterin synthase catalytic subunit n=1 Tax=Spirosoma liriopis TaxID=2937440 RepID=A0ABT0HFN7_9BACT|nr:MULTISPECIES: molybdenum cofactor biosynthesis protein MoaE [Spirosoma]MCK8490810.1 molybdenum cofactor biosynthesis protein MoaE [Spirosoma liriopis]UHG90196.1 molybdenum cofactor biosynthesis protein MoaE [Spirosoma oryzicola]